MLEGDMRIVGGEKRKEIAVKNKHVIISLLILSLVIILVVGGGITIYRYGDKIKMFNALADKNMKSASGSALEKADVAQCNDAQCILKIATAKASHGKESADFCNRLPTPERREICKNQFYKEKAISTKDATWCSKTTEIIRDYCYHTLYTLTHNKELCNYIKNEEYKTLC